MEEGKEAPMSKEEQQALETYSTYNHGKRGKIVPIN